MAFNNGEQPIESPSDWDKYAKKVVDEEVTDGEIVEDEIDLFDDWFLCPDCLTDSLSCIDCGLDLNTCECMHDQITYCMMCERKFPVSDLIDDFNKRFEEEWEAAEAKKEWKCVCDPEAKILCIKCGVARKSVHDPWGEDTWAKDNKNKTYVQKCRHYGLDITFPNGVTIKASSERTHPEDYHVDWGLYAYSGWKPSCRHEMINWPDYGWPKHWDIAADAIIEMYRRAEAGQVIEIGCMGGHGRTGCIMACMAVMSGVEWQEACKWVWDNYCYEAIESNDQEWYVKWFYHYLNGLELPTDYPPKNISHSKNKFNGWDDWDEEDKKSDPLTGSTVTLHGSGEVSVTSTSSKANSSEKQSIEAALAEANAASAGKPKHIGEHGDSCDPCRYFKLGFGALTAQEAARNSEELAALHVQLQAHNQKVMKHYPAFDKKMQEVYCPNCNAIWPCHDSGLSAPKFGAKTGDWEYNKDWGWVWSRFDGTPPDMRRLENYGKGD